MLFLHIWKAISKKQWVQLADSLEEKFRQRLEAVENLYQSIQQSYRDDRNGNEATYIAPDCCEINSDLYEEDFRFKSKVNAHFMHTNTDFNNV